jgi:hypothetical protein
MGLFDRLRRRPPAPAAAEDEEKPRLRHYEFAHFALRQVALSDPLAFLGNMASELRQEFLAAVLAMVDERFGDAADAGEFTARDFRVLPTRVGRYPCAIVVMPPPGAVTEAHLIALVMLADLSDPDAVHGEIQGRYFTLEQGIHIDRSTRTVLCEWTADGQHLNYGDCPEPTPAAFAAAIEPLVRAAPDEPNPE